MEEAPLEDGYTLGTLGTLLETIMETRHFRPQGTRETTEKLDAQGLNCYMNLEVVCVCVWGGWHGKSMTLTHTLIHLFILVWGVHRAASIFVCSALFSMHGGGGFCSYKVRIIHSRGLQRKPGDRFHYETHSLHVAFNCCCRD